MAKPANPHKAHINPEHAAEIAGKNGAALTSKAMGGELEIVARFNGRAIKIRNFADLAEKAEK